MSEQKQVKVDLKEVKLTVDGVWINNLITDLYEIPAKHSKALIDYLEKVMTQAINETYAPKEEGEVKEDNRIKLEESVEVEEVKE